MNNKFTLYLSEEANSEVALLKKEGINVSREFLTWLLAKYGKGTPNRKILELKLRRAQLLSMGHWVNRTVQAINKSGARLKNYIVDNELEILSLMRLTADDKQIVELINEEEHKLKDYLSNGTPDFIESAVGGKTNDKRYGKHTRRESRSNLGHMGRSARGRKPTTKRSIRTTRNIQIQKGRKRFSSQSR